MAYRLYMDGILFPVTPSKITMKINGKNETVTLINEGEIGRASCRERVSSPV